MNDPLQMNIAGRLMLMLSKHGVNQTRSLSVYLGAVGAVVRQREATAHAVRLGNLEPFLNEQLEMLQTAMQKRRGILGMPLFTKGTVGGGGASPATAVSVDAAKSSSRRQARAASGYVPVAKKMEDKLKDDRKPIQKLLLEDCVAERLLDVSRARDMVAGMTGKAPQDAEREIVEYLREVLQAQVKQFIRSDKGGPWSNPHAQEDLRQDIHAANSVRGVLLLCRQIVKEHQSWEEEHDQGGILGLFSPRRRSHGA